MNYNYLGVWKCKMEQYVFGGSRGSGIRGEARFLVYTPTTTTTTTSTRAPVLRDGRTLDFEHDQDEDIDVTLDVNLLEDKKNEKPLTKFKNLILSNMFSTNLISGCVALSVMVVFLSLFAYIVRRHRAQSRARTDEEQMPSQADVIRKPDSNKVSRIPDHMHPDPKIQWGSPKLRNKIPLSPETMLSTCSSNRSSRRTSLTSIVPSINPEEEPMDISFMMKVKAL